jgi:opacity protein-like surface antigen
LKVYITFITTLFPGSFTAATFGQVAGGAVLGGGIEVRLIDHWSLRGEYLYVDFGSQDGSSRIVALGAPGQAAGTNGRATPTACRASTSVLVTARFAKGGGHARN